MKTIKHIYLSIALILATSLSFSQVGIGTKDPQATLDIIGEPTNTALPDGVLVPRLSLDQINEKHAVSAAYGASQVGALVFINDVVTPLTSAAQPEIANIDDDGFYYFTGTVWDKIGTSGSNMVSLVFAPEYDGAALRADGNHPMDATDNSTDNILTLIASATPDNTTNYYEATNYSTANLGQYSDYDIVFQVKVPDDFKNWNATDAIQIKVEGTADAFYGVGVYKAGVLDLPATSNDLVAGSGLGSFSTVTIATAADFQTPTLPGDMLTIVVKLSVLDVAMQGDSVMRVGDIIMNYSR